MSCHTDENPQTTTRRRFQLAACLAVLCITHPASANSPRDALGWLRQQLETLSRAPDLQPGKIAVLVSELTGRTLFAKNAELSVPIASNVKLVTAIAALSELGPAYRFATRVYVDRVVDGVVKGNLYVRGSGDPSLAPQHLWRIARYLKHFGIKRISGRIVLDERLFDDQRLPPLFETRTSDMYYRAATGALSLNENAFAIQVLGGDRAGQAGRVIIEPTTDYITTQVDLQTVGRRARTKLELSTQAERARTLLTIKGQLRPGYRGGWHLRRVEHPALFFGLTLRHELQAQGIRIDNHDPVAGKAPSGEEIYVVHSAPLASLVRYMTKSSSNFVAEQLLKVLEQKSTVLREHLRKAYEFFAPCSSASASRPANTRSPTDLGFTKRTALARHKSARCFGRWRATFATEQT